ncbi:MAG: winged helix-turn-helix transcriptional regulator [Spirochaetaceae bacterium]|nr:winged helix-turn-helix transcriptional regulator [Spirochaetaceae bacterium]
MNEADARRLERRASLLKTLAHPSRLLIVEMLEERPRCVTELTEAIGADITTVSKHLAVLKRAGFVRDRKRGTHSDYELLCGCISHFVDCVEKGMDACSSQAARVDAGEERQGAGTGSG